LVVRLVIPAIPTEPSATRAGYWREYIATAIPPVVFSVVLCAVVRAVVIHVKYVYGFATLVA
jgi:hypothetical protein